MVKRKFTRKELQHDQLVDVVSFVSAHLQRHWIIYLIALAAAVAGAVFLTLATLRHSRAQERASELLGRARTLGELAEVYEKYPATAAAPMALMTAAAHFFREGRFDRSLTAYRALLDRYPDHPGAPLAALGAAHSLEGLEDREGALEIFRKAREEYPDSSAAPEAVFNRARIHLDLGRTDSARSAFEELIIRYPWSVFSHLARERLARLGPPETRVDTPLRPGG